MSDPEKTIPPVKAAARGILASALEWSKANPDKVAMAALVVAAFVLGRCTA